MNEVGIKELIKISHYAAANIGYIQGGGGNTSVKLSDHHMAVKASGCKLSDMAEKEGYVVVDYKELKEYFKEADEAFEDFEKTSGHMLQASIVPVEGLKPLRPSVEAGFHSLLKKYVIHTHSVYANVLCCCREGKAIASKILDKKSYLWMSYVDPGAKLTLSIAKAIENLGYIPDIIFMENHGVIISADTLEAAIALHEQVNNTIRDYLELNSDFPQVTLEEVDENIIKSTSPYVATYFSNTDKSLDFIREKVLYPDQLVYLNNSIFKKDGSASDIYFEGDDLTYNLSMKQAQVNEETLVAYLYVIQSISNIGLELVSMSYDQQAFILGWESEAYRKSMLK